MNKKLKWKLYEKRWDLRQIYFHTIIRRHICEKYFNLDPVMHYYARQLILSRIKTNCWIRDKILSGEPFMVARFGNTELSVMAGVLRERDVYKRQGFICDMLFYKVLDYSAKNTGFLIRLLSTCSTRCSLVWKSATAWAKN